MPLLGGAVLLAAGDADLILHNAKVLTVDSNFSIRQAVAIKGNRIVMVGSSREVLEAERGARTRVIDLGGRTLLPGLIDSHLHPLMAALSEARAPLPTMDSIVAVQQFIRERMASTPKGQWIVIPHTFPTRLKELRMPTRKDLDVATEHPIMFDASYAFVLNSFALRMCGITRNTPDPPQGKIMHDENGEPNGMLKGELAFKRGQTEPDFSEAEKLEQLDAMLRRYAAAGLTASGRRSGRRARALPEARGGAPAARARRPYLARGYLETRRGSGPRGPLCSIHHQHRRRLGEFRRIQSEFRWRDDYRHRVSAPALRSFR